MYNLFQLMCFQCVRDRFPDAVMSLVPKDGTGQLQQLAAEIARCYISTHNEVSVCEFEDYFEVDALPHDKREAVNSLCSAVAAAVNVLQPKGNGPLGAEQYVRLISSSKKALCSSALVIGDTFDDAPFRVAAQLALYRKNGVDATWIELQWQQLCKMYAFPTSLLTANHRPEEERAVAALRSVPFGIFRDAVDKMRSRLHRSSTNGHYADALLKEAFEWCKPVGSKQSWEEYKLFCDFHMNDVRQRRYKETKDERLNGPDFRREAVLNGRVEREVRRRSAALVALVSSLDVVAPSTSEDCPIPKKRKLDDEAAILEWLRNVDSHGPPVFFPAAERTFPWTTELHSSFALYGTCSEAQFQRTLHLLIQRSELPHVVFKQIKKHGKNLRGCTMSKEDVTSVVHAHCTNV